MRHHFVPQHFLRDFLDHAGALWCYPVSGRAHFSTGTAGIAHEIDLYGEFETRMTAEIENPANPVLDKVRAGLDISRAERARLARYIVMLWKRRPKIRDDVAEGFASSVEARRQVYREQYGPLGEEVLPNGRQANQWLAELEAALDNPAVADPTDSWRRAILLDPDGAPTQALIATHWRFYVSKDAFVTCDDPVLNWIAQTGQLAIALGRSVALVASRKSGSGQLYNPATAALVDEVNRHTIANATRFVFAHRNDDALRDLIVEVRGTARSATVE